MGRILGERQRDGGGVRRSVCAVKRYLQTSSPSLIPLSNVLKGDLDYHHLTVGSVYGVLKQGSWAWRSNRFHASLIFSFTAGFMPLQDAFASFTKLEKIEDPETKFTCESCKEEVSIEKLVSGIQLFSGAFELDFYSGDGKESVKASHSRKPLLSRECYKFSNYSARSDLRLVVFDVILGMKVVRLQQIILMKSFTNNPKMVGVSLEPFFNAATSQPWSSDFYIREGCIMYIPSTYISCL